MESETARGGPGCHVIQTWRADPHYGLPHPQGGGQHAFLLVQKAVLRTTFSRSQPFPLPAGGAAEGPEGVTGTNTPKSLPSTYSRTEKPRSLAQQPPSFTSISLNENQLFPNASSTEQEFSNTHITLYCYALQENRTRALGLRQRGTSGEARGATLTPLTHSGPWALWSLHKLHENRLYYGRKPV